MKPGGRRLSFLAGCFLLSAGALIWPNTVRAQAELAVKSPTGGLSPGIRVSRTRGYATVSASELARLGWRLADVADGVFLQLGSEGPRVEVLLDQPFLRWDGDGVHLADASFRDGSEIFLPLQFLIDIVPWKLPDRFDYQAGSLVLEILEDSGPQSIRRGSRAQMAGPPPDPTRVVVIDAGHGGRDPGTVGGRGTREKHVALAVALALAEELEGEENVQVFLTREDDTLVPIWKRGELATTWKGDRHGIFISIHANALPNSSATRGFETYFLSEARTEHERRVAALENAAVEFEDEDGEPEQVEDMSFILTELRNLDHQHWSALLAEFIQAELARIHPGPNRGVKQGPLAVITNTLMPAVLEEVGFLSNRDEERLLTREEFQRETARAVAEAVRDFFQRYPPSPEGSGRAPT